MICIFFSAYFMFLSVIVKRAIFSFQNLKSNTFIELWLSDYVQSSAGWRKFCRPTCDTTSSTLSRLNILVLVTIPSKVLKLCLWAVSYNHIFLLSLVFDMPISSFQGQKTDDLQLPKRTDFQLLLPDRLLVFFLLQWLNTPPTIPQFNCLAQHVSPLG